MNKHFRVLKQLSFIIALSVMALGCKKEQPTSPSQSIVPPAQFVATGNALTIYNGNLITDGYFSNNSSTYGIYQWNGTTWSIMGSPIGYYSQVKALTVYNGNLIMAGDVPNVEDGVVQMWNGTIWQPMGNAFNESVNALTIYNGNLIAGGQFDTNQHGVANKIAEWNGIKWLPMADSGMQVWSSGIYSLTVYNGNLIMGGSFVYYGRYTASNIALFNGSTWLSMSTGLNATIYALSVYNGRLVAGGSFTNIIGVDSAKNIAQWNGSAWTTLGTSKIGTPAFSNQATVVLSLTDYNNNLIAGGSFFSIGGSGTSSLAEYNGSSWSSPFGSIIDYYLAETAPGQPFQAPGPDVIQSSIMYNGNLIIGGSFNSLGNVSANGIAQWNGSSWSAL